MAIDDSFSSSLLTLIQNSVREIGKASFHICIIFYQPPQQCPELPAHLRVRRTVQHETEVGALNLLLLLLQVLEEAIELRRASAYP